MTPAPCPLRRATLADATALWMIRHDAIRYGCRGHYPDQVLEPWAAVAMPDAFRADLEQDCVVVATVQATVAGFASLKMATARIEAVFVSPHHARRGLGRSLLARLETIATDAGLQSLSLTATLNAVPFYRALGFAAVSDGTYRTSIGVDIACVHMRKTIGTAGP